MFVAFFKSLAKCMIINYDNCVVLKYGNIYFIDNCYYYDDRNLCNVMKNKGR